MSKKLNSQEVIGPVRHARIRNVFFVGNRNDRERVELAFAGSKAVALHWLDTNSSTDLKSDLRERLEAFGPKNGKGLMVTSGSIYANPTPKLVRELAPQAAYVHITSNIEDCTRAVYNLDIDQSFHYTGDLDVYRTAVRMVEAHLNFCNDNKPITLVVEDQPNYYTPFLKTLERFNRGRTWVLLARTYEEAQKIVDNYGKRLCAVISDWQYMRNGARDENAGEMLIQHIKKRRLRVPVILNSSERGVVEEKASKYGAISFWKNHPDPLSELSRIMNDYVFGGFIFRTPHGVAVTEPIHDAKTLAYILRNMTEDIVVQHSDKNDFSRWLQLQGYLMTAKEIKPWTSQDGRMLRHKIAELLEREIEQKERVEKRGVEK